MSNTTPNLNLFKYDPTVDGENTFNIDTCMNDNWDKLDTAVSNISIESKTYAELKTLKDNNQLKQGKKYLLTDYRTKYQQPTTLVIKEMLVEQLILTANSSNSFEPIVSSPTYFRDIIYYNFNDNVCEDNTTPRTGFIQRRIDTVDKNDCPQDWRTMLWARYKPDATRYYYNGNLTQMQLLPVASVSVSGYLYKYENSLYISKTTGVPTSPTDSSIFYQVYEDINVGMLIEEKTKIADKVELKKGELHERLTFGNDCYRNYISETAFTIPHDNVFGNECNNNNLLELNYKNTFGNNCTGNNFETNVYQNILMNSCNGNSFGPVCHHNTLLKSCDYNSFRNGCYRNILSTVCYFNSFGNNSYGNTLAYNCTSNSFGNGCYGNVFGYDSRDNSFGNHCENNIFGQKSQSNIVSNGSGSITAGELCIGNFFGEGSYSLQIGNGLKNIFAKFINAKNLINLDIYNKTYTITMEKNSNNQFVYWYLNSSNQPVYTVIP